MSTSDSQPTTTTRAGAHPSRAARAVTWWKAHCGSADGDPATRARLRRCRSTLDALAVPAAVDLARRLGAVRAGAESPDWLVRGTLDLARVLAHVREHDPAQHPMQAAGWKTFAGARRESEAGEDRPRLSEARFRRLLQIADGEEKAAAFTRLVALLDGRADVGRIAEDFLLWSHPERGERVREQWAFIYYAAGSAAPAAPSTDDTSDEDSVA